MLACHVIRDCLWVLISVQLAGWGPVTSHRIQLLESSRDCFARKLTAAICSQQILEMHLTPIPVPAVRLSLWVPNPPSRSWGTELSPWGSPCCSCQAAGPRHWPGASKSRRQCAVRWPPGLLLVQAESLAWWRAGLHTHMCAQAVEAASENHRSCPSLGFHEGSLGVQTVEITFSSLW